MSTERNITIITTCKPFEGLDAIHQANAIESWCRSGFEVLIIGGEPGVAEICDRLHCGHHPDVTRFEGRLPFVSSLFEIAERTVETDCYAYVNSDIIFNEKACDVLDSFMRVRPEGDFLLTARRRNIPLNQSLDFERGMWQQQLDRIDEDLGTWEHPYAVDFFLLNKGWVKNVPPLMIGHAAWDNWMLVNAAEEGVAIIDASSCLRLYHPLHGYKIDSDTGNLSHHTRMSAQNRSVHTHGAVATVGQIDTHAGHIFTGRELAKNRRDHQALFEVDVDRLFCADIIAISETATGKADADNALLMGQIHVILTRALRFVPKNYSRHNPPGKAQDIVAKVQAMCARALSDAEHSKGKAAAQAIDYLQDWFLADFTEMLRARMREGRALYIWGAGEAGRRLYDFLMRRGLKVSGFLDRMPGKVFKAGNQGKAGNADYGCLLPEDLLKKKATARFILLASVYDYEMVDFLEEQSCRMPRDFVF